MRGRWGGLLGDKGVEFEGVGIELVGIEMVMNQG
jgi:hypothetical protein